MPLHQHVEVDWSHTPFKVVDLFKYLGIHITLQPLEFLETNINPLMEFIKNKLAVWKRLPISVAGRIGPIKMILLPKCLNVFSDCPVIIPQLLFQKLHSHFTRFIWARGRCKLQLTALQRSKMDDALTLPDIYLYYLAEQLKHLRT